MAGNMRRRNAEPVGELATAILDPVLRKRAGISMALIQSWDEIAGERLARRTRPERIVWPRRMHEDDPFQPAALIVACEGAAALHLQHESGEVIARVNAFLGFAAIGRLKIVQKPVRRNEKRPPALRALAPDETAKIARTVGKIEDPSLRAALERLGQSVAASRK
jgi:hypothetical protein